MKFSISKFTGINNFSLLESVLHFQQPHSPPGSPSQSPSTKCSQIPFTYISLGLACQISSLLSQISLSPFKIWVSLTNTSNLLFCTGKVNSIHAIKRGVEVYLHSFLTSALDGGEWSGSRPAHFKARKSVPRILYLEAWWAPELLCTFLRVERHFAPTGNWTTNPQLSSPYPSNYAAYACYFAYEELIFTNTMCQKNSLCESLSFAIQLETSWPGGCTCSSARKEVCKMCCLRLVKAVSSLSTQVKYSITNVTVGVYSLK